MKILWGTMLLLAMASAGCDRAAPEPEAPAQAASPDIMACAESVAGPEASAGSTREDGMNKHIERVDKTEDEWRDLLSPEQFRIARMKGTERAFTGAYWDEKTPGVYQCVACALPLFDSGTKFDSGTGWPSFFKPLEEHHIAEETDHSHGMVRTEVLCARCDAHLGHVFQDGPEATGLRYCINSASLTLVPREEEAE